MAKRCETGIPKKLERAAIYVANLPKYPEPGTPEYYACMPKWYAAYQEANRLDGIGRQIDSLQNYVSQLVAQIGLLQGQLNSGQPALDALVGAYSDCMNGGTQV